MPEGHTIHGLAGRLDRAFTGHQVEALSPQGRFADGAARLDGQVIEGVEAHGKHLFVDAGLPELLHVHLGLIGRFSVHRLGGMPPGEPVGTVRLRLVGPAHVADLRGPMVCALIDPSDRDVIVEALGPDPLRPEAADLATKMERSIKRIRNSSKGIGELLMDQSIVAGVGNVYRCEVLFRHGIDPFLRGRDVTDEQWHSIWTDLVDLLAVGVDYNQIITMQDQVDQARAELGTREQLAYSRALTGDGLGDWFERRFYLYQRAAEPCRQCANPIHTKKIGGRTLYWCPVCQPPQGA